MTALTVGLLLLATSTAPSPTAQAPRAYTGIYLSDVSGFDLREGRFKADLDVWMKWSGSAEPPALRFVNGEIETRDEQERESDGNWHSIRWRVQGTFRGTFPLHAFPFDRQELRIQVAVPEDTAHLSPDLGSSGMAPQFSITGWEYEPFFRAQTGKETLASDLGSIRQEGRGRQMESVSFIVDLKRPATSNIIKFMLPLAIILAMSFLVFALPSRELEVRASMGVTALLSVVAFHFAMSDSLPDVPYMVAADRLFLSSYVLVLLTVLETVISYRLGEKVEAHSQRLDRIAAVLLTLAALGVGLSVGTLPLRASDRDKEPPPVEHPAGPPVAVSSKDELRVGVAALPSLQGNGIGGLLRRGLTVVRADGELRPHLAEAIPSMTDSSVRLLPDGGMLVRWRLRPGLRWSDGVPLTSRDLSYSLSVNPDADRIEAVTVDERTIEIRYRRRLAEALTDFALYPEHAAKVVFADGGMDAIRDRNQTAPLPGDGPYRLASFTPGKEALFERNPHFAGTAPAIGQIRFRVIAPDQMANALRDGTVDFLPAVPTSAMEAIRQVPTATVNSALDDNLLLLQPDLSVPALGNVQLRRALLHALDRAAIAGAFVGGPGRVANTYRPDDATDFAHDAVKVAFAPEEARKLLKGSGGAPALKLISAVSPAGSGLAAAAELVAAELTAVGIKLERVSIPSNKAAEAFMRGDHGGLLLLSRRGDRRPSRFFNLPGVPGGQLDTRTPRPQFPAELVELNQRFETSLFPERRLLLSGRFQRAFAENLPLIPLAFGTQVSGTAKALRGFGPGQSGTLWWNVETWAVTDKADADQAVAAPATP